MQFGSTTPALVLCTLLAFSSTTEAGLSDLLDQGAELLQQQTGSEQASSDSVPENLDTDTLTSGLKDALEVGTRRAVETLAATDGYYGSNDVKIPLPSYLYTTRSMFVRAGLESQVEAFELSMNRAAEDAVTEATPIFVDAVEAMTIEDARQIYSGGDSAATEYFREHTYSQLKERFRPRIESAMASSGVTAAYQTLLDMAESQVALLGNFNLDLADHVTEQALDGLFLRLAAEEQQIRKEPVARTTDLLKQVFGN
ncbi:DUF4197 domain-containing protein [Marinobacterium sp. YM272]|uniref:DUF4197 domain-containing protein n=1 Tax=Marinobacterium sp. YM272 TaxID=3421654 RepID=UPI003D7F2E51